MDLPSAVFAGHPAIRKSARLTKDYTGNLLVNRGLQELKVCADIKPEKRSAAIVADSMELENMLMDLRELCWGECM